MQAQRTEINFEGQNLFIGIDMHLKSWTVSILTEKLHHKTFSQPPHAEALKGYLDRNFPKATCYSVYEAGFSGFWAHYQLTQMGIRNIVVNPADVPTTQKEQLQKDDPTDSRKLARSLRANELAAIYVPHPLTLEERSLVRLRATLVKDLTRFKLRIKSFLYFHGISYPAEFESSGSHWSRRFMVWLKEDVQLAHPAGGEALQLLVKEAEQQRALLLEATRKIRTLAESEKYAQRIKLLRSIPGIGLITAVTLMVEIEDISRFGSTDHLAGFLGLVPSRHSSGDKDKNGEMTFRGHDSLRRALIESAWVAARKDPALNLSFHRYAKRMETNKAIVRVARKVLNRIYFVLKKEQEYVLGVV